jgi:hypothetical protein
MRKRSTEYSVSFNVWTVQGSWFWSLAYPRHEGGAIGAAASQSEAIQEARAAAKQLALADGEHGIHWRLTAPAGLTHQIRKDSRSRINYEVDRIAPDSECSQLARALSMTRPAIGDFYHRQVALRQYVTQVVHN